MELGAAGHPRGVCRDTPAGTYIIQCRNASLAHGGCHSCTGTCPQRAVHPSLQGRPGGEQRQTRSSLPRSLLPPGPPPVPAFQPRQPVRILQQLPGPAPALEPNPGAPRVRGDFMELMMIQSSQMHQVLMNSLALSALTAFGLGPPPDTARAMEGPLQTAEGEEAVVLHHHYIPYPCPTPVLAWPGPVRERGPAAVRYLRSGADDGELAVPPPPPPSATGTVGADVPAASEYYNVTEERL